MQEPRVSEMSRQQRLRLPALFDTPGFSWHPNTVGVARPDGLSAWERSRFLICDLAWWSIVVARKMVIIKQAPPGERLVYFARLFGFVCLFSPSRRSREFRL